MTSRHARAGIRRGGLHTLLHRIVAGNGRNRKEGVIVAGCPARFEGRKVATGTTTRAAPCGIHRMAGVQRHVFIRLKTESKALMALQAQAIVFRGRGKHRAAVHVVATRASSDVELGMAAHRKLLHRVFVAATAKVGEVLIAKASGGFCADRHTALIVHIVAIGAGRAMFCEMRRGQESVHRAAAGAVRLVMAFDAGLVSLFKREVAGILDEETEAPAFAHVGQARAMAGFTGDGVVRAIAKFAMVACAAAVVAREARGRAHFAGAESRLPATIHAHGKEGNHRQTEKLQAAPVEGEDAALVLRVCR